VCITSHFCIPSVFRFIQSICLIPLQMTFFSSYSLRMYHKLSLLQNNFFLVIDATSNLLSGLTDPFDNRIPFYYTVFVRCPDKGVTGVPVFEFASTSQTFASISQCLMSCMERYVNCCTFNHCLLCSHILTFENFILMFQFQLQSCL